MIILSNTALSDKTDKELFFNYKVVGFADGTWDYKNVFPVLNSALPETLTMKLVKDLALSKEQTLVIKKVCEHALQGLIENKEEYPEGTPGDIKKVLGKNIRVHLKDSQDKIISTFFSISRIADECLKEDKTMYFSVIENNAK